MRGRSLVVAAVVIGAASYLVATRWRQVVVQFREHTAGREGPLSGAASGRADGSVPGRGLAPGTEVRIELAAAPAEMFEPALARDAADDTYAAMLRQLDTRSVYDPVLGRAAREVAYQSSMIGDSPPEAVLTFLLQSAGAPDSHAAMFRLSTTSDETSAITDAIRGALADAPDGDGELRVGVGEAETPDERFTRRIVVLLSRRDYALEPAPRRAALGSTWTVRGKLPVGFSEPTATVLTPAGELATHPVEDSGGAFSLSLAVGDRQGELWVSVDGVGRHGPTKLFQLGIEVGRDLPRAMSAVIPAPEPAFADIVAAEKYAFELLARDRAAAGLPRLERDPALAHVARAHSEEMRQLGYFAHLSPRTGLASDRLSRAGYRSTAHAENLARNETLVGAEASLMASVSHRANIVRPVFVRAGVGVARGREGDRDTWFVTQLFATPVVAIDPGSAPAELVGRLNQLRRKAGRRELGIDDSLVDLAEEAAGRAARGEARDLPDQVARSAQRAVGRSVGVSVHVVYGLDQFEPPDVALRREMTSIGVGVVQSADDIHGRTGIVVIVAR